MVSVDRIGKRFGDVVAVDDVSFAAARGEILGLLGPNGAGKTTTIRMIMGIMRPDVGAIRFANGDAGTIDKTRIGYLPEERGLYDDAKVLDLLAYFAELKGVAREASRRLAAEWLERLDLTAWAARKVEKLSKGMQQKVQFAAAVLHRPAVVVLDEPFSGLDPVHQDVFKGIIRELRDDGMAILLSSHQMNRVEELCDRIFLIHRGQQVLYGPLVAIKEEYGEHAARLRFAGDAEVLRGDERIDGLVLDGDTARFTLPKGLDPDEFVRGLPRDLVIREIAIERPPLHDIFVRSVTEVDR